MIQIFHFPTTINEVRTQTGREHIMNMWHVPHLSTIMKPNYEIYFEYTLRFPRYILLRDN